MNESDVSNLDTEYKRYLHLMHPYFSQLLDEDVIKICNAWILKLSNCKDEEKILRNKYIFTLCCQLAKGVLDKPFLSAPSSEILHPLADETHSDDLSSEVECVVIDSDTKEACDAISTSKLASTPQHSSNNGSECDIFVLHAKTPICYNYPENPADTTILSEDNLEYQHRAANFIKKLREIKKQNLILHNELLLLREESKMRSEECQSSGIFKVNTSTSTNFTEKNSVTNLDCLKTKLQEIHDSRNILIESLGQLQNQIDNYNIIKKHEIDEIKAKHKLEIIKIKTSIREEVSSDYENQLKEMKQIHQKSLREFQVNNSNELEKLKVNKDETITNRDTIIQNKDIEINQMKNEIDELKRNQLSVINKLLDKPGGIYDNNSFLKIEALEKKICKSEKEKSKLIKVYEAKIVNLQKQKQLAECNLQFQAMKQRSQAFNDIDENQSEIHTALDKLENKYKGIVANVQATAVQRRMQDQMALDAIIQAVCGSRNENPQNPNSCKTMRNTNKDNQGRDVEYSTLFRGNKVGSVIVGNKSYADDGTVNDYCVGNDKLCELVERIHIPQRDTGDALSKK